MLLSNVIFVMKIKISFIHLWFIHMWRSESHTDVSFTSKEKNLFLSREKVNVLDKPD